MYSSDSYCTKQSQVNLHFANSALNEFGPPTSVLSRFGKWEKSLKPETTKCLGVFGCFVSESENWSSTSGRTGICYSKLCQHDLLISRVRVAAAAHSMWLKMCWSGFEWCWQFPLIAKSLFHGLGTLTSEVDWMLKSMVCTIDVSDDANCEKHCNKIYIINTYLYQRNLRKKCPSYEHMQQCRSAREYRREQCEAHRRQ